MEINAAKTIESTVNYPTNKNYDNSSVIQGTGLESEKPKIQSENIDNSKEKDKNKKELSRDDIININGALNSFMTAINSDLHFVVHGKTKELMMQVVDRRDNKVVKEIPNHEMLDVIANIREYVGSLVDKRA